MLYNGWFIYFQVCLSQTSLNMVAVDEVGASLRTWMPRPIRHILGGYKQGGYNVINIYKGEYTKDIMRRVYIYIYKEYADMVWYIRSVKEYGIQEKWKGRGLYLAQTAPQVKIRGFVIIHLKGARSVSSTCTAPHRKRIPEYKLWYTLKGAWSVSSTCTAPHRKTIPEYKLWYTLKGARSVSSTCTAPHRKTIPEYKLWYTLKGALVCI